MFTNIWRNSLIQNLWSQYKHFFENDWTTFLGWALMGLHWEVISPNYNIHGSLFNFLFIPYLPLLRKWAKPGLSIVTFYSGLLWFSSACLTSPSSSFSSPWFFLSWVPTSPSSTFFLLVIINVQVVLIPFYVSRHWLSPHHSALGYFFYQSSFYRCRLFSVIYLQLLKIQLILVHQCWSNSVAFWRWSVPSNVFCTMYATNYGYLCPSGMISLCTSISLLCLLQVSAILPNLNTVSCPGCSSLVVHLLNHLRRLKHFGEPKSIFKMVITY